MSNQETERQNPFTKPGFIAATLIVTLIVMLGIVLAVINAGKPSSDPPDPLDTSAPPATTTTSAPAPVTGGKSICGLNDPSSNKDRLTSAPKVEEWAYEGTIAYPVSSEYGPGAEDKTGGFRYCFQHSPEGAVFAVSYALAVGSDQSKVPAWIEYFAAPGPYRDKFFESGSGSSSDETARLRMAGFRLLSFTGDAARVDIAILASTQGRTLTMSIVYHLVWVDGDWKIDTSTPEPGSFSTIPDLVGYLPWSE